MTTVTDRPTGVDLMPYDVAFDLITDLIRTRGVPHPTGFDVQGYGVDPRLDYQPIMTLAFDSHAAVDTWASLLGFPDAKDRGHHTDSHFEYGIREAYWKWNGWSMYLRSRVHVPVPVMFEEDCGTCRQARLDNPAPQRCFWRGCSEPQVGEEAYCAEHVYGEPKPDHHAQVRREMVEALQRGPSNLATYSTDAINSALADGVIVAVTVAGVGHHLYALRVDPAVAIAEGREINLTTVGGYFRETWAKLPALRRAELVEACQFAGWMGDWDAAYRHVMGNPSSRDVRGNVSANEAAEIADDARLIVSELDDLEHVDVKQLAAVADVDPDAEIAYAVAHRHEPVPVVDVLTVDPELADVGRGDAEIARIGQPIDLTQDGGV